MHLMAPSQVRRYGTAPRGQLMAAARERKTTATKMVTLKNITLKETHLLRRKLRAVVPGATRFTVTPIVDAPQTEGGRRKCWLAISQVQLLVVMRTIREFGSLRRSLRSLALSQVV